MNPIPKRIPPRSFAIADATSAHACTAGFIPGFMPSCLFARESLSLRPDVFPRRLWSNLHARMASGGATNLSSIRNSLRGWRRRGVSQPLIFSRQGAFYCRLLFRKGVILVFADQRFAFPDCLGRFMRLVGLRGSTAARRLRAIG